MPSTLIARRDMAYLLAAARLALTQQLAAAAAEQQSAGMLAGPLSGCSAGVAAGFGDAALAALPGLLDDGLLQEELLARWWGRCRGLAAASEVGGRSWMKDDLIMCLQHAKGQEGDTAHHY